MVVACITLFLCLPLHRIAFSLIRHLRALEFFLTQAMAQVHTAMTLKAQRAPLATPQAAASRLSRRSATVHVSCSCPPGASAVSQPPPISGQTCVGRAFALPHAYQTQLPQPNAIRSARGGAGAGASHAKLSNN